MSDGENINFRYARKQEMKEIAEGWDVDLSAIYQGFSNCVLDNSCFRKYMEAVVTGDREPEEVLGEELDIMVEEVTNYNQFESAVYGITAAYVFGREDMLLDGFKDLDESTGLDVAELAAEALERAEGRLD